MNLYSPSTFPCTLIALGIQGLCYARLRWGHPFVNMSSILSANGIIITTDGRISDIRGNLVGVVHYIGKYGTGNQPGKYHVISEQNPCRRTITLESD